VTWQTGFTAYDRVRGVEVPSWQGSLLADRRTGAGLAERRARLYDPGTGRFTQPDPLGWAGGATPYGFADGDPLNRTDPFGLCPMCVVGAIWAAYEVGSGLYDVYSAVRAVSDPRLGTGEKITAVALATVGFLGPGGGLTAGAGNIRRVLGEGADLIGRPGRGRAVREVSGGLAEAQTLFERLAAGGQIAPHPSAAGGLIAELPGGGRVGFRPASRSGGPAVDISVVGVATRKIHFYQP
jgi:RHS repeat-associated protein